MLASNCLGNEILIFQESFRNIDLDGQEVMLRDCCFAARSVKCSWKWLSLPSILPHDWPFSKNVFNTKVNL